MNRAPRLFAVLTFLTVVAPVAYGAEYKIDGGHSTVLFAATHFSASHVYGRFNDVSGTVQYDATAPEKSSVEVEIRTESIDTANERRDTHLKSPDFFDARQFPVIHFKSTGVEAVDGETFKVTGDLTLHGVKKSITIDVNKIGTGKHPRSGAELIGFEARFSVNRSDFGMSFMVGPVSDEIRLIASFETAKSG